MHKCITVKVPRYRVTKTGRIRKTGTVTKHVHVKTK